MMKKRLKNKKGFTLIELLVALLITAMAGMIALGGLAVGANAYRDILLKSEAQLLMKEYMDSFRSILTAVSPDSGFPITEDSKDSGIIYLPNEKENCAGYFTVTAADVIVFQPVSQVSYKNDPSYAQDYMPLQGGEAVELVVQRLARDFTAELDSFQYANNAFTGKIKLTSKGTLSSGEPLIISEEFMIYPLNYNN